MENVSPDDTEARWFHENRLLIRNNDAILDKAPIFIKHGKKSYSASDGGFLTYRARFFEKDGHPFVELRLFESDYVFFPVRDPYSEITIHPVTFVSGSIAIDGVRYQRKELDRTTREHLLDLLSQEPMEKQKKAEAD
jgi:hypothetical protein